MLELESLALLHAAAERLDGGFASLPNLDDSTDLEAIARVLMAVADRLKDNYPYPHPLYAGQMLKPPHTIARLAYSLALWMNPNNHALDGGRASSAMEKEAVAELARMFGWSSHLGHLCGGGTMANLEALWVAGEARPGQLVVASEQAHYTHSRLAGILGLPFREVACDRSARLDLDALEEVARRERIGTVIATLGTTATGSVDPLPGILDLQARYRFRVHVDAAYGGYFSLVEGLREQTRASFGRMSAVDSIAIDPHKHGLQPYGCGCILFRDPAVGALYAHDSPYTYFSSAELHLGEISLECSRAGASAVALWATQRLLPLVRGGEFARRLECSRRAALGLAERMKADDRWLLALEPELDIVVWARAAETASRISEWSRAIFAAAAAAGLHLAVVTLPGTLLRETWPGIAWDRDDVVCLRSCLMKPEHLTWLDSIWATLNEVTDGLPSSEGVPGCR